MAHVLSNGARLYWEEHGSGPAVLLIMGLSFTHEMWFRVLPHLTDAGYRPILFDNRGMGQSDCPRGPYSIRKMTEDALAVLDAAGVDSAHVVGASMGGMIAQELALRAPERVRSLVLGCTTSQGSFGSWPHFRYFPPWDRWSNASRPERERALRSFLYAEATPLERIEEDMNVRCACAWSYKGFFCQLAAILMWSSYGRLRRIQAPTLVLHGDEDHLVPPENGRILASRISRARFELLPQAGHMLITDQPELSTRLMLDFLRECSR